MKDDEYKEFLKYLFDEYMRERIWRIEKHFDHFHKYDFKHEMRQLQKSVSFCRFVYTQCYYDEEVSEAFKPSWIKERISQIKSKNKKNLELIEVSGLLDCIEAHYAEIMSGLEFSHIPLEDQKILESLGSRNPEQDLKGIVYLVKKNAAPQEKMGNNQIPIKFRLEKVDSLLSQTLEEYTDAIQEKNYKQPQKKRRWFKGLGQIGQGVALSMGNLGLAAGMFSFPVSPETQTWGALVSGATGVGMVMNGIGDLRGE